MQYLTIIFVILLIVISYIFLRYHGRQKDDVKHKYLFTVFCDDVVDPEDDSKDILVYVISPVKMDNTSIEQLKQNILNTINEENDDTYSEIGVTYIGVTENECK